MRNRRKLYFGVPEEDGGSVILTRRRTRNRRKLYFKVSEEDEVEG